VIVLDTDVLTLVQRASGAEFERLTNRLDAAVDDPICVSIVSFEEQMRGWLAWIAKARTLEKQQDGYVRLREQSEYALTSPDCRWHSWSSLTRRLPDQTSPRFR